MGVIELGGESFELLKCTGMIGLRPCLAQAGFDGGRSRSRSGRCPMTSRSSCLCRIHPRTGLSCFGGSGTYHLSHLAPAVFDLVC